ncbi:XdhC family protein [Paenibacillus sp. NPDC058071]|uniref:XdhC family protein n=1 Tax=Paenibacillus sp. NPDC058071 TaxID=3346326 RepID=UPI0036DA7F85
MNHVLEAAAIVQQPAMLATIVRVRGHSYRKAGASMLFLANGRTIGSLSPGCLEDDLAERLESVMQSGRFEIVGYNLNAEEDPIWGEAVGCGGSLEILLEPVDNMLRTWLSDALGRLSAGVERLYLIREIRELEIRRRIEEGASLYGKAAFRAGASLEASGEADCREAVTDGGVRLLEVALDRSCRVVLFGAGRDAEPICSLLLRSGFEVVVADWRPALCAMERFPGATGVAVGSPDEVADALRIGEKDYVLVSSHRTDADRAMIDEALRRRAVYIGVLGSKKRIGLLFGEVPLPPSVHAPVGLRIGADGPDEIAVSIAAEMIKTRALRRQRLSREIGEGRIDEDERRLPGGGKQSQDGEGEARDRTG